MEGAASRARFGAASRISLRMKVDHAKAIRKDFGGETFYLCSEHCLHAYEARSCAHGETVPA
jgi:YHS domain-containing protein